MRGTGQRPRLYSIVISPHTKHSITQDNSTQSREDAKRLLLQKDNLIEGFGRWEKMIENYLSRRRE
jgi:hypothetical protein